MSIPPAVSHSTDVPDAELLIAPGCPHCAGVLGALTTLIKEGRLGRLQVIDLGHYPDEAARRDARAVPWLRLGPFTLTGAHTTAELRDWATRAGSEQGRREAVETQLAQGELDAVIAACRTTPALCRQLLALAADLDTPFAVRVGVGAVFEDLGPDGLLGDLVEPIDRELAHSPHPQVRADAAHFLGLSRSLAARDALQRLAEDADAEVREIAAESLAELASGAS